MTLTLGQCWNETVACNGTGYRPRGQHDLTDHAGSAYGLACWLCVSAALDSGGRYGATAGVGELPAMVRSSVVEVLGSVVVKAESQRSGFTPGFASHSWLADGRTAFVKAANSRRSWLVESYALEAANLELIPAVVQLRGYGVGSTSPMATPAG